MIIVSPSVITFGVSFSQLLSTYCKQYRPRSDYFLDSRLIMVHIVCFNEKRLKCTWIHAADVQSRQHFQVQIFFNITFYNCSSFGNTIRISISLDPDYVRHSVGPHLGPSCSRKQTCPVAKELMWPFGQFSIKKTFWCSLECLADLLLMCNNNLS